MDDERVPDVTRLAMARILEHAGRPGPVVLARAPVNPRPPTRTRT